MTTFPLTGLTRDDMADCFVRVYPAADGTWRATVEVDCGTVGTAPLHLSGPCKSSEEAKAAGKAWRKAFLASLPE